MKEAGIGAQGNDKDIDKKESPKTVCRCKENETNSRHTRSGKNQSPAPKLTNQIPDYRTFNPSFKTGGTVEEGNSGAAHCEISL